jgi:hypothetical protein
MRDQLYDEERLVSEDITESVRFRMRGDFMYMQMVWRLHVHALRLHVPELGFLRGRPPRISAYLRSLIRGS